MGEVHTHPAVFGTLLGNNVPGGRAVPVAQTGTGTTGAVTATLPAAANRVTYITGLSAGAAGTGTESVTVGSLSTANGSAGTLNFTFVAGQGPFNVSFNPPLPASAVNTTIVVTAGAHASATAVSVTAVGFRA
jgi:hypothetical protein